MNRSAKKSAAGSASQGAARPGQPGRGGLYVVGVGASAGGLEALEQFFSHLPPDTGSAFVLMPHLEPTHKGMMPELARAAHQDAGRRGERRDQVQPNHVYVIPPNADLAILHGKLQVLEPVARRGATHADRLLLPSHGGGPEGTRPSGSFFPAWGATARWV